MLAFQAIVETITEFRKHGFFDRRLHELIRRDEYTGIMKGRKEAFTNRIKQIEKSLESKRGTRDSSYGKIIDPSKKTGIKTVLRIFNKTVEHEIKQLKNRYMKKREAELLILVSRKRTRTLRRCLQDPKLKQKEVEKLLRDQLGDNKVSNVSNLQNLFRMNDKKFETAIQSSTRLEK